MNYYRDEIWYPSVGYIKGVHEAVIEENKEKTPGTRYNPVARIQPVLHDVRTVPGIYSKAATLLKSIRREHVFNDGNTTTAILVTIDFLQENNKEFKPSDQKLIAKVANNYKYFKNEEIAKWLKTGEINERKIPEH